jgi:hypothetical protein
MITPAQAADIRARNEALNAWVDTVRAVNGRVYHGTYYKSSGNYARIKARKR